MVAVPFPLLVKATPEGNAPVTDKVGAGLPDATTVNDPAAPRAKVVLLAVGIVGADGAGGSAAVWPPPPPQPVRKRPRREMPKKIAESRKANVQRRVCADIARRQFFGDKPYKNTPSLLDKTGFDSTPTL
jgi:hypothetical protein